MFTGAYLPYRRRASPTTVLQDVGAQVRRAGPRRRRPDLHPKEGIVRNTPLSWTGRAIRWATATVAAALAVAVVSVPVVSAQQRDIVDTAVAAGQFNPLARDRK